MASLCGHPSPLVLYACVAETLVEKAGLRILLQETPFLKNRPETVGEESTGLCWKGSIARAFSIFIVLLCPADTIPSVESRDRHRFPSSGGCKQREPPIQS